MSKVNRLMARYGNLSIVSRATIWFTIANFFNTGVSMLTTPVVSRMLSTSEYGVISVYHTWESIFMVVATLYLFCGSQEVTITKNKKDQNQVTGSLMVLSLFVLCALSLLYFIFQKAVYSVLNLDFKLMAIMLSDIGSAAIMQFWLTSKRFNYSYKILTAVTMAKSVLRAIFGIAFVAMFPGHKVVARLFGLALPDYVFAIPILTGILRKTNIKGVTKYWKNALKFNIVLIPHYLSGVLLSSSDRIMVSRMVGNDKAGIYSMMYTCASVIGLFYSAANSALSPFFLQSIQNKDYRELNKKTIQAIFVTVICSVAVILAAPEILKFFAPKAYYEGVSLIPALIFGLYLNFFYLLFSNFAFYYEKKYLITCATIVSAALNITLNYICIPVWGYKAAAYTTVAGYLFLAVTNYLIYRRLSEKVIFDLKKILAIMASFCVCTILSVMLYPYFAARVFFVICIAAAFYVKREKIVKVFIR